MRPKCAAYGGVIGRLERSFALRPNGLGSAEGPAARAACDGTAGVGVVAAEWFSRAFMSFG